MDRQIALDFALAHLEQLRREAASEKLASLSRAAAPASRTARGVFARNILSFATTSKAA